MITLASLLSRWPLWLLHALGALLGWLGYWASPSYRRRLRENAAAAGVDARQRRAAVAEAGRLVLELPRLWLRARTQPIADPVRWDNAETLERWLRSDRGLVLLTPHMGSFEMAAQAYAERYGAVRPMCVLYRPARQAWLRRLEETARTRTHLSSAPATLAGVRQKLRALKQGHTLGLLPDQVPPAGLGEWAPFFGRAAYTMTLAARLVQQTGAAIGVLWCERLAHGGGYVVHVREFGPGLPTAAAPQAAAAAVNRCMEAVIRECPAQYLWGYHRYKAPRAAAAQA